MSRALPVLWVLTTTFPRWQGDAQPPFVFELSRRLAARFQVYVIAPRAPGAREDEVMSGLQVLRYRYFWRGLETLAYEGGILGGIRRQPWRIALVPCLLVGLWLALRALRRRCAPDVVHAHWLFPQGWIAALSLRGIPLVTTSHGADLFGLGGAFWELIRRQTLKATTCITVVSRDMAESLHARGATHPWLEVAPMGVDLREAFTPDESTKRDPSQLLFVGRLVPKKGVDLLLRSLAVLAQRGIRPLLTLAGDGPERANLERLSSDLGLTARVTFLGRVANEQLPRLYRLATALVAPFVVGPDGDREGLGLVVVEAMGCQCPVVTTRLAEINDAVHAATAWIADATPDSLADAIAAVLDEPAEAARRASRARREVMGSFDWTVVAERYGDILERARSAVSARNA